MLEHGVDAVAGTPGQTDGDGVVVLSLCSFLLVVRFESG